MKNINFIDGKWLNGSGPEISAYDKSNNEILWEASAASDSDILAASQSAKKAFEKWSRVSVEDRISVIQNYQKYLKANIDELSFRLSKETGKPPYESTAELNSMIAKADISIEAFSKKKSAQSFSIAETLAWERHKPHGMVGVIGPYNMPGHLPNGHILPAILAGNTVLFKPSELTPDTAIWMTKAWEEAGLPAGVLNLLQGYTATGVEILNQEDLKAVFFTGSSATGAAIHKHFAGRPWVLLALEMGGNNPLIIHQIGERFEEAADMTIESAYISAGQRCTCARRLILLKDEEGDRFLDYLIKKVEKVKAGFYYDEDEAFMGPLISEKSAEKVQEQVDHLLKNGSKELVPLRKLRGSANLLSPCIIDSTDRRIHYDDEIFGPVLQVFRVDTFEEAIKEANNTQYGLAAALFSNNRKLYESFLENSQAGIVNFNRKTTGASSKLPFGGIKQSGSHWPGAYTAADYCSYPVASLENKEL